MHEMPYVFKKPVLACGADLKGSFAIADRARVSLVSGYGDLAGLDNLTRYERSIDRALHRLKKRPGCVIADLHPGYHSTRFAAAIASRLGGIRLYRVQHHEAHIASALVDNRARQRVIGVAFDGTGYGHDGALWGGEFFLGTAGRLRRAAHFAYLPMPGLEMAIREPWRMAASYLYRAYGERFLALDVKFVKMVDKKRWGALKTMIDRGVNSPPTSGVGRLFDAMASIILAKGAAAFEAELPMALERAADQACCRAYDFIVVKEERMSVINVSPMVKGIVADLAAGRSTSSIAAAFHNTIARIVLSIAVALKRESGARSVVLSGGVFQNVFLARRSTEMLTKAGFAVLTHRRFPANDGGLPIGQIAIAGARRICV